MATNTNTTIIIITTTATTTTIIDTIRASIAAGSFFALRWKQIEAVATIKMKMVMKPIGSTSPSTVGNGLILMNLSGRAIHAVP